MPNHHGAPWSLASERGQAFIRHSDALISEITSTSARSADVSASLEAMKNSVMDRVRTAARDWNRTHDILRVLPLELREMCWSHLSQLETAQLALVCSSWRDLSRGMPSLWTVLHLAANTRELDRILALSGHLPLDFSALVFKFPDLVYVDECLHHHAHRLVSLRIYQTETEDLEAEEDAVLFQYPAPLLERLSLDIEDGAPSPLVHPLLFNGYAPKLHTVMLYDTILPSSCPAFSNVTDLAIKWRPRGFGRVGLEHLFTIAPCIETLELTNIAALRGLPAIPPSSPLQDVRLFCDGLDVDELVDRGYFAVPHLLVRPARSPSVLYGALTHHPASFDATLSISANGEVAVYLLGPNGEAPSFTVPGPHDEFVREVLSTPAYAQRIKQLCLPSSLAYTPHLFSGSVQQGHPYLGDFMLLPALRTLVISHGATGTYSLFDPTVLFGVIVAPQLERIKIHRELDEMDGLNPIAIGPAQLVAFIARHVACGAPGALDVFVDRLSGVELTPDGPGLELLRGFVGSVRLF